MRLRMFFLILIVSMASAAFAIRTCKIPKFNQCGCVLCGNTLSSGYCTCHISGSQCTTGCGGYDELTFSGTCTNNIGSCGTLSVAEAQTLAKKNRSLKRNKWLYDENLPKTLEAQYPDVARIVRSIQKTLLTDDKNACNWSSMTIFRRNNSDPKHPIRAELQDKGNVYELIITYHELDSNLSPVEEPVKDMPRYTLTLGETSELK